MASKLNTGITAAEGVIGALIPEAQAAITLFSLLEPEAQRGIAALIAKVHHKTLTAQDYLDQAAALINARTADPAPAPVVPSK